MSVAFSAKLSMLRKEKDLTQRQAAADLGISQALLSHYENGIRECNLDFVEKAARYYGVSADYLLGLTETKAQTDALFGDGGDESDAEVSEKTLLHAVRQLSAAAETAGARAKSRFLDYFSLAVKRYTDGVRMETQTGPLCTLCEDLLLSTGGNGGLPPEEACPAALKTLQKHGEEVLKSLIEPMIN